MQEIKRARSYLKKLSKKHGISQKAVNEILIYGLKNMCSMIKEGEDIRLQKFGNIYFKKKDYNNYLKSKSKRTKNGKNYYDPGAIRKR